MQPLDFVIVGSGWRTEFFLRVAAALPGRFRCLGVMTRSLETGAPIEAGWSVPTFRDLDALLAATRPTFALVSVPQPVAPGITADLAARGIAVLTETPPAPTMAGLLDLWRLVEGGARIQVAEQLSFQPLHRARLGLVHSGRLGEPTFAHVSYCHGYHGTSLIRRFLGIGYEPVTITARAFEAPIVMSPGRGGPPEEHRIVPSRQVVAQLDFGDKLGIYDFTGDQYFSWIRSSGILVRGSHGELRDDLLRYLIDFRTPMQVPLLRHDAGASGNLEGLWHKGYTAGESWVYRNPFPEARLSDDEIAVATSLAGMGRYLETGDDIYSFAEAAQDQALALAIEQAASSGAPVVVGRQPWAPGEATRVS